MFPGSEAEVDMYVIGWSTSTGDADWGIRPLMAIESEPPMSYNVSYYENEEVDQLLKDALATADDSKRAEAYAKAQDIIWEEPARMSCKRCKYLGNLRKDGRRKSCSRITAST